jgi:hypothetical protein
VIPVEVTQTPWHYTTFWDWVDHWQTLIAGGFALLAGFGTVVATMIIANRQIAASGEEAKKVIAATRDQTAVAQKQIVTTLRLERRRAASEGFAFHAMLLAAMKRVLEEADAAKKLVFGSAPTDGNSDEAYEARIHFTKIAFTELRDACVRYGGRLTEEFLGLEIKIDNFKSKTQRVNIHQIVGVRAGFEDELAVIETMASHLSEEAAAAMKSANAVIAETDTSEQ